MKRIVETARSLLVTVINMLLICGAGLAQAQEKHVGGDVEVRTILNLRVPSAALVPLLPASWELSPPNSGPAAGANMQVTFADQISVISASGVSGPPVRYVIFSIPVRKVGTDNNNLMIIGGFSPAGAGPYGTNLKATEDVQHTEHCQAGQTSVAETWKFDADGGQAVYMELHYVRGAVTRERGETRVYSQVKPEFSRVYRFEQGVDIVRGGATGEDHLQNISFRAVGGKFARIFDGSETLISVTSLPWYSREVFLPAP